VITSLPPSELDARDYVPQAIISRSIFECAGLLKAKIVHGQDDLDEYEGAVFLLNRKLPFSMKHYKAHPNKTTTVYLPYEVRDVAVISEIIALIMHDIGLDAASRA